MRGKLPLLVIDLHKCFCIVWFVLMGDHDVIFQPGVEHDDEWIELSPSDEVPAELADDCDVSATRKRPRNRTKTSYVWCHTRAYDESRDDAAVDGQVQCNHCLKWFSGGTNASGWKNHLLQKHRILDPSQQTHMSRSSSSVPNQTRQTTLHCPTAKETELFDGAVTDYIVESLSSHVTSVGIACVVNDLGNPYVLHHAIRKTTPSESC